MRRVILQLFRIAMLVAIAWILRDYAVRARVESLRPVSLAEVRGIFPEVTAIRMDTGPRGGWHVAGSGGEEIGYVLQTAPLSDGIIGYRGWSNALVIFSMDQRVLGVRIRASQDTVEHVSDVRGDRSFLKTWNGKSWEEVAGKLPEEMGIEGVSGATMTSMAVAEGIVRRLRAATAAEAEAALPARPLRVRAHDVGLALVVLAGLVLVFTGTHGRGWVRRIFQVVVIVYVGFVGGDLLAQSLIVGWAENGVPWRTAPALALLLAVALLVPWATGKPLYCQQLCPHGHAQELLSRVAPKRWRIAIPRGVAAGLRWLPPLTGACIFAVVLLVLPCDLAGFEPFDAYLVKTAGTATLTIAVVGLAASCFVPMAYCHYGCPTGALLEFLRSRGSADRFGRREVAAVALVLLAAVLSWASAPFNEWLQSAAADWL